MANYETTVKLPSLGIPYENVPQELSIRAMTVKDEKLLYGGTRVDKISQLLSDCITTKGIDPKDLVISDKLWLLIQLRILSYGDDYYALGRCPYCDTPHEHKISLNDISVEYLTEKEFTKMTTIKLPVSGHEVVLRLSSDRIRSEYVDAVDRIATRIRKSNGQFDYDGAMWLYRHAYSLVSIDGEVIQNKDRVKRYEDLPVRDAAFIRDRLGKVESRVSTGVEVKCPSCNEDYIVQASMGEDFFLPRFD